MVVLVVVQIGSRSSVYSPESNVRKTGSYIYEEFMPTDGTDVKVLWLGWTGLHQIPSDCNRLEWTVHQPQ